MKYFIVEKLSKLEKTAWSKARNDVEEILVSEGYQPLEIFSNLDNRSNMSTIKKIRAHFCMKKIWEEKLSVLKSGDSVFFQFPVVHNSIFLHHILKKLKSKGIKIIALIHDMESIRLISEEKLSFLQKLRIKIGGQIMDIKKIRKAVIPAAGLGTRVLPATKAQPKEMLVIVDKPALQYLVEELVESGIEEILIVTGRNKSSIENHFDYSFELEKTLEEKGKKDLLKIVDGISEMSNIYYVRQKKPLGLGHAISCAEAFVGDEPFVVLLGDDIIYTDKEKGQSPVTKQLIEKYEDLQGGTILGVQEVDKKNVSKYGIIKPLTQIDDKTVVVEDFIEKPIIEEAPSNLAALGRYVLEPEIFSYLKNTKPGKGGEIQLTDAILAMKNDGGKLYAYNFEGLRYDTGDKFGMFIANVEFGLRHEELKDRVREYLKDLIEKL